MLTPHSPTRRQLESLDATLRRAASVVLAAPAEVDDDEISRPAPMPVHAARTARSARALAIAGPSVAHEFNGLLLTMSAGVMHLRGATVDPAQLRSLELIDSAAQQARLLARAMTRLTQREAGTPRDLNLIQLLQEVAALARCIIPPRITFVVTMPSFRVRALVAPASVMAPALEYLSVLADRTDRDPPLEVHLTLSMTRVRGRVGAILTLGCQSAPAAAPSPSGMPPSSGRRIRSSRTPKSPESDRLTIAFPEVMMES
ncbi:hypothetical protein BH11PLA1_BH11PLA1_09500 [soil metagenome]